jgi:hypothetical protein
MTVPGKRVSVVLALLILVVVACEGSTPATTNPMTAGITESATLIPSRVERTLTATPITGGPVNTLAGVTGTAPLPTKPTLTTSATSSSAPTATARPKIPTVSPSATAAPEPMPTPTYDGPGCLRPPDDYSRVEINGETLNGRTFWMLGQAAALYDGPGDLMRVTQGSYSISESTSFDTHAGGGAVDISIRNPANPAEVLWDETDAMVRALRLAGFAAWYRAPGDLGPGSPAHIHAIAIGDRELSPAAVQQLTGPGGYFAGFDGLPPEYGGPHPDPHGGPIVCPWMIELGYVDGL